MMSAKKENKCRICFLTDLLELCDWRREVVGEDFENHNLTGLSYLDVYCQCTQIVAALDDDLPQWLCRNCTRELTEAYKFILKARRADQELRIKSETTECKNPIKVLESVETAGFEWVAVQKLDASTISQDHLALEDVFNKNSSYQINALLENGTVAANNTSDLKSKSVKEEENNIIVVQTNVRSTRSSHTIVPDKDATPADAPQTLCEYCCETFPVKQLKRHISREHKQQKMLCHACPRTFKDASTLRQHSLTHETNRERNYSCEQCKRKFYTQSAYQSHIKTHDTNRKPLFQCDQCEKSFFHKGSLKLHTQYHTGDTIECKVCQKRYLRRIDLEIHLRTHSGDTPYKCSYCDKAFTQVGILNKHLRHHEGYRYKCDICSKEYTHQSTLIQHRKEHTGLPLKCAICGKGFVKKSKMRRHIGGVHKMKDLDEMEKVIIKVKTKKEYRGRILETS